MTYCVAMCLSDGLVFASDSRTNAGVDHIATFKKLHVFHQDGERVMVLQSAGNLATTQSVISLLSARIRTQQEPNLMQVTSLYDAAMLIGKTLQEVIQRDSSNQQMCCALISIDSTLRSNLSVGLPLDTLLYRSGSLSSAEQHRITENDPYFNTIRKAWSEGLQSTFLKLPPFTPGGQNQAEK